ncbi:MAG: hypothetical protein AUJ55_06185 [Proteobacteria bacterium CG1_02_64_396]|nr:MAG: hypothetical protein AUJ55_06185 [Proteobacteria bacterium CG1_02_64_396]
MEGLKDFLTRLRDALRDLLPIVVVIALFQAFAIGQLPPNLTSIASGLLIVAVGLALFIQGLELGVFPVGENLAYDFIRKGSLGWLLLFAFLIGFATTIAEPALLAIAEKAQAISAGRIDALGLRVTVAVSVGCAIVLGVLRILLGHPIHWYIIGGYILVVLVTFWTPPQIVGLAYDSGGVTTSTVTVPLVAALGIGLATMIKGRNPVIDGFGLIAFASLTPMIFVQLYGIAVYAGDGGTTAAAAATIQSPSPDGPQTEDASSATPLTLLMDLLGVVKDILPIVLVIAFFQYGILRKAIPRLKQVAIGFGLVILGLYAFIVGLEMGLFPIGETMAIQLTAGGKPWVIYLFGFLVGFATTMAEPALIAIALKASEVSKGRIHPLVLRVFVAFGVAVGIALGCYRIVQGDSIHHYLIVGYLGVILLTWLAPRYIVPIAYDSGGVTTSTVTVPLVAALGIGLATNIEGRSPLVDGFGLIAFASLFPMLTVMAYGILSERTVKPESRSQKS